MKYSKTYKHNDGSWYVLRNKKHFLPGTKSDTEEQAILKGKVLSASYYLRQATKALEEVGVQFIAENFDLIGNAAALNHLCLEDADKMRSEQDGNTELEYYPYWA